MATADLVRGPATEQQPAGPSPASPAERGFRPDIEGLRAVAVLLVILGHAGVPLVGGGYVGVDVFFVISGFLITSLLFREVERTGRISIPRFYARRAIRLLPAAAVVLIVTLVAARLFLPVVRLGEYARDALAAAGYAANLRFAETGTDYLRADQSPSPFQHFWSLAVEEQFYLVWPLLILAAMTLWRRRRPLAVILGGLVAVSFVLSVTETARSAPWAYFGPHTRAWELGAGALLALGATRINKLPAQVRAGLGLAGLAAILVAALRYDDATAYPGWRAALPVVGAVALIAAGGAGVGWLLNLRPMQIIGRLSYGWYLWHWPVLLIGPVALGISGSVWQKLALAVAALGVAWCSYRWVESPVRHRAALHKRARRGLALGAALSAAVAGVVAIVLLLPHSVAVGARQADLRAALDASADPAAVLAQSIASAPRKVPANLTPKLTQAAADKARVWTDGCHADVPATTVSEAGCVYGDPAGTSTVVLFGDSHAAHWFPAMERLAIEHRWRLVELSKTSCSAVDVPLWLPVMKREYTECTAFRRSAIARIERLRPALVVIGSTFNYEPAQPVGDPEVQWREGWKRTFSQLVPSGARVVAIADTPHLGRSVPECLASEKTTAACGRSLPKALRGQEQRQAFLSLTGSPDATIIDPIRWFCSDTCPPVIGNLLVYRDSNHMTSAYSTAIAPLLDAAIPD